MTPTRKTHKENYFWFTFTMSEVVMKPQCIRLGEFKSLGKPSIQYKNVQQKNYFRFVSAILQHTVPHWAILIQSQSIEKTRTPHLEPLRNTNSSLLTLGWKAAEMDWVSLKQ